MSTQDVDNLPAKKNDIRDIRKISQLAKVNLDLDSPRMKLALENLGVGIDELERK